MSSSSTSSSSSLSLKRKAPSVDDEDKENVIDEAKLHDAYTASKARFKKQRSEVLAHIVKQNEDAHLVQRLLEQEKTWEAALGASVETELDVLELEHASHALDGPVHEDTLRRNCEFIETASALVDKACLPPAARDDDGDAAAPVVAVADDDDDDDDGDEDDDDADEGDDNVPMHEDDDGDAA